MKVTIPKEDVAATPGGEQLGKLKQEVFNFLPSTVKTERGGAVSNTTINWDNVTLCPKQVTFATSTPKVTNEDMIGLAAPLAAEVVQQPISTGSLGDQSTLLNLASEFKKMREPKIQKLKGGNTSSAQLFITGWIKEVRTVICDRNLSDQEGVQLIREFTESKARQQVDFFLDMNLSPTIEGVLDHLISAFSSGEDESSIKSEFYSRKQLAQESEDDYAEVLQILARKIMVANPAFQAECNGALIHQFANGLRDDIIRPLAKDLANRKPGILFIKFWSEVANLSGSRLKRSITKVTTNAVEDEEDIDRPTKKNKQERQSLDAQIKTLLEQNRSLSQKVDSLATLQNSNITEAVSQAVNYSANRFGGQSKNKPFTQLDKPQEGKPYLGKELPPKPTQGKDGSLNVAETCHYCKNPGHLLDNCVKLQDRIDRGLARPVCNQQKPPEKIEQAGTKGPTTGPGTPRSDPYKFTPKIKYSKEDIDCLFQTVTCNTISSIDKLDILEKAVTPCPEINIQIKQQKSRSLLDSGSMVTLMTQSYFDKCLKRSIPEPSPEGINAHNLFNLKGVGENQVPLCRYFTC